MNTKNVLLACELGGGLGHIKPLLRIADGLADRGYTPFLAVRNLTVAWAAKPRHPVLQAPTFFWKRLAAGSLKIGASFSDVLAGVGFTSVDRLMPMVQAWLHLLRILQPKLVIADYSPALCVATYRNIPTLNVGFGFIVPPTDNDRIPPLIETRPPLVPETKVFEVIQNVLHDLGRPSPKSLTEMFASAESFLTVLPQLDHYAHVRTSGHLGPLEELLPPQSPCAHPKFFAYLKADAPRIGQIVAALSKSGFSGRAFLLGGAKEATSHWQRPGFDIVHTPPAMTDILTQVQVVIHHGGINVAQQALAAGRTQLVFPMHLEQALTGKALHGLGVGHMLKDDFPIQHIPIGMRELMQRPFVDRATAVANEIHSSGPWHALRRILDRCQSLLTERKKSA